VERFKLAVVSSDPAKWVSTMFPAWTGRDAAAEEDLDLSNTEGTWVFEDTEVTPEEAEAAFAELMEEQGGVLTWDDLQAHDDDGWQ
jgi:hypothetical protein